MSENGEIYTTGKNFTLPPSLTALTNSTSDGAGPKSTLIENVNCNYLMDPPSFLTRQCFVVLPFVTGSDRTGSPSLHTTNSSIS